MAHPLPWAALLATLYCLTGCSPAEEAAAQTSQRSWDEKQSTVDGVYTAEQAARGKKIHTRACYQCHADGYYKGRKLVEKWSGQTLSALNVYMVNTMPQDRPSSLSPAQYVDVMAYLLSVHDFPVGEAELPGDQAVLDKIIIEKGKD